MLTLQSSLKDDQMAGNEGGVCSVSPGEVHQQRGEIHQQQEEDWRQGPTRPQGPTSSALSNYKLRDILLSLQLGLSD